MLGANNSNQLVPISFGENHISDDVNALPQLQQHGGFGCIAGPVKSTLNQHTTVMDHPAKRVKEAESVYRQKNIIEQQLSLSNNISHHDACRSGIILNPDHVSIGLRLSNEEDEPNSSVTCLSESKPATLPMMFPFCDDLKGGINVQKEDFDHYIKLQEENFLKGVRELGQRHTVSLLSAIDKGISSKLQEKELEIQKINCKNKELVERIKQVSMEVQSWHCKARYNESVVNVLKSNLEQVMAQGAIRDREGFGDSEVDTAASYANQNQMLLLDGSANSVSSKMRMTCRACKINEACVLLFPCRHLCLCKICEAFVNVCPACHIMKTSSIEVFIS